MAIHLIYSKIRGKFFAAFSHKNYLNIIVYSGIKMQYHFPEKRQIRLFEILRECQSRECKSAHMSMSPHNLNAKRAISRQK